MCVLRRIPRTDPTEDMHGQLLVARRGRRGQLEAPQSPVGERAAYGDDQRHREGWIGGRRDGRAMSLLAV